MNTPTPKPPQTITGSLPQITKQAQQQPRPPAPVKINIATPAYRSEYVGAYVRSFYMLLSMGPAHNVRFSFQDIDYADIVTSRNFLVSNWYFNKPDCSHMLFLDSDMGFEAELIFEMLRLRQELVGALYQRRSVDMRKLHSLSAVPYEEALAQSCEFIGRAIGKSPWPGFVEADHVGTGIMLISRACIDKMVQKNPALISDTRSKDMPFHKEIPRMLTVFDKVQFDGKELSEDFSFCYRWRQECGGKVWANITRKIGHVSSYVLETRFAQKYPDAAKP